MYFVRFVLFCTDVVNDFLSKNCPYVAGAISFYMLFSMFPLLLALISITGFILPTGSADQARLAKDIGDNIPISTELVSSTLEGVVSARRLTGIASILGLLWAATAAFGAIRKGINAAWGIKKTRPFLRERLIDLSLVLGAGVVLLLLLVVAPALSFFEEITDYVAPDADLVSQFILDLVARIVTPVLYFLSFLILYRYMPNAKVTFGDVWLGALGASIAFVGAMWGFVWYVKTFPVYNVVYGSVGAIMALLTWVYVSAIILLFGALVTSRYATYTRRAKDTRGVRIIWTGLSRVRLRVVASTEVG